MTGQELEVVKIDLTHGVVAQCRACKFIVKQGDRNSRVMRVDLIDNGQPFQLASTQTVRLYVEKPDKTRVFVDGSILNRDNGQIQFVLTEQMLTTVGDATCEVLIIGQGDSKLSTPLFTLTITRSLHVEGALESTDEFNALVSGLNRLDTWEKTFQQKYDTLEQRYAEDLTLCKGQVLQDEFTVELTQQQAMRKVGTDGTTDVHNSIQDGMLKSAVLKGKMLVNAIIGGDKSWDISGQYLTQIVKGNIEPNQKYFFKIYNYIPNSSFCIVNSRNVSEVVISYTQSGTSSGIVTTNDIEIINDNLKPHIRVDGTLPSNFTELAKNVRVVLIKYQDGVENWDIPYFEGMASVVNPSVTSVGKNLFDGIMNQGSVNTTNGVEIDDANSNRTDYILLPKGTYVISNDGVKRVRNVITYNESKVYTGTFGAVDVFTLTEKCYVRLSGSTGNTDKLQLESGSTPTTYEPYKSNTVTSTDKVILRRLPNGVCDTLNLLTGEYVQRIGEFVLDGTETFNMSTSNSRNHFHSTSKGKDGKKGANQYLNCDKFPVWVKSWTSAPSGSIGTSSATAFQIGFTFTEGLYTLETFKQMLASNPVTVQYELATPIVKTVDLTGLPFSYKNGHVMLSSEKLTPIFTYVAPTNRSAQITQNNKAIVQHDKQINALELALIPTMLNLVDSGLAMPTRMMSETGEVEVSPMADTFHYMLRRLIELNYDRVDLNSKINKFGYFGLISEPQRDELSSMLQEGHIEE